MWGSRTEHRDFLALAPAGPEGLTVACSSPRAPQGNSCSQMWGGGSEQAWGLYRKVTEHSKTPDKAKGHKPPSRDCHRPAEHKKDDNCIFANGQNDEYFVYFTIM